MNSKKVRPKIRDNDILRNGHSQKRNDEIKIKNTSKIFHHLNYFKLIYQISKKIHEVKFKVVRSILPKIYDLKKHTYLY